MRNGSKEFASRSAAFQLNFPENQHRFELFSGLADAEVSSILAQGTRQKLAALEFIGRQSGPANSLALLESGLAALLDTNSEGEVMIVGWVKPGDACDLSALLPESPSHIFGIQTTTETEILRWSAPLFATIVSHYPTITRNALRLALSLSSMILERLRILASEPVERRLAILLHQTAEQIGRKVPQGTELNLSDEQLSQIAGTTLFSVSRMLQRWERSGFLTKSRGRILIHRGVGVSDLIADDR